MGSQDMSTVSPYASRRVGRRGRGADRGGGGATGPGPEWRQRGGRCRGAAPADRRGARRAVRHHHGVREGPGNRPDRREQVVEVVSGGRRLLVHPGPSLPAEARHPGRTGHGPVLALPARGRRRGPEERQGVVVSYVRHRREGLAIEAAGVGRRVGDQGRRTVQERSEQHERRAAAPWPPTVLRAGIVARSAAPRVCVGRYAGRKPGGAGPGEGSESGLNTSLSHDMGMTYR